MDQKAVIIFESKQGDHVFQYHLPLGATWQNALEAASDIFNGLKEHIKEIQAQADQVAQSANQVEPIEVSAPLEQVQDAQSEQEKEA